MTEIDIVKIAKLMKIEISDNDEHVKRVQKMIQYFDVLDSIDLESKEITPQEISLDDLRDDTYIPYDDPLIQRLKNLKDTYIKAPKMI